MRTSSAGNLGADKDSERRQRAAIESFARSHGYEVVDWFYDAAISGRDPVDRRPGFMAMLDRIAGNGVRVILVESPDRFARDLTVQLTGHDCLKARGIDLVPTTAPDFFLEDTPTAKLVREILGAVFSFERASLVAKLRGARERKRATGQKCEGGKSHAELRPGVVEIVRKLRRRRPKGGQRSFREIARVLASMGYVSSRGTPFSASSVRSMLRGR